MAVDYIGRVERLEQDLAELVRLLNSRPGVPKLNAPQPGPQQRVNFNSGVCDGPGQAQPQRRRLSAASAAAAAEGMPKPRRRRLPPEDWKPRNGTLNLCDKNDMLRGRYQQCYAAFASFYAEDMRLLHGLPETRPKQH